MSGRFATKVFFAFIVWIVFFAQGASAAFDIEGAKKICAAVPALQGQQQACLTQAKRDCETDAAGDEKKLTACKDGFATAPQQEGETPPSGASGSPRSEDFLSCQDGNIFFNALCGIGLKITYALFYYIPSVFAFLAAMLLDFFIFMSIQGDTYNNLGFIRPGWEILRDFANIGIIAILGYIGITLIFGIDADEAKKKLFKTFLVALLINFSFYFSTLIIDLGNLVGHAFYNNMEVAGAGGTTAGAGVAGESSQTFLPFGGDVKSISLAVVSFSNPQKLFAASNGDLNFLEKFLAIFAAGAFALFLAYCFFKVVFLFLTRIVGLWLGTLFSCIVFLTLAMPSSLRKAVPAKGFPLYFEKWLITMVRLSLSAPVFLFLLYLIVIFLNSGFNELSSSFGTGATGAATGLAFSIIDVLIPFAVSVALILFAVKMTQQMTSEDFLGGAVSAGLGKAGSFLGGLAFGGLGKAAGVTRALGRSVRVKAAANLRSKADAVGGASEFLRRQNWGRALTTAPSVVAYAGGRLLAGKSAVTQGAVAGTRWVGGREWFSKVGLGWDGAAKKGEKAAGKVASATAGATKYFSKEERDYRKEKKKIADTSEEKIIEAFEAKERVEGSKKESDDVQGRIEEMEERKYDLQVDMLEAMEKRDDPSATAETKATAQQLTNLWWMRYAYSPYGSGYEYKPS